MGIFDEHTLSVPIVNLFTRLEERVSYGLVLINKM